MGRIERLAPDLADQIAAGEVVERPASVVKELVENAIDAGSTRVSIVVELGGKKLIRVQDDGEGMDPEDARLAVERHATSKIRRSDDLAAITTLGFRGEALPSIASVSHFTLRTRRRDSDGGTEVRVNGGLVESVREVGTPAGTLVEVADLFYNLPARRKFLKSDSAESAQMSRVATQLALAYPEVGFRVVSGGRTTLDCPPAASSRDRLYQLYGERDDLLDVRKDAAGMTLTGYIAALAEHGPRRGPQHVFINRRIVKDRTIAHAILDAYSTASIKERSPEVHLFLEMRPDALDVNVHPTKAEVRFREQSVVHEVVRRGLMEALGRAATPHLELRRGEAPVSVGVPVALPGVLSGGVFPSRWSPTVHADGTSARVSGSLQGADVVSSAAGVAAGALTRAQEPRPLMPLGQFRETFIVAVDDEGVAIIDQHVAHERVLFERTMERLTQGPLESQRLLVPLLIDLGPAAQQALQSREAELARLGFEVDGFGSGTIRVQAVPALLPIEDSAATIRALAEDLEGLDHGAPAQAALSRLAATMACHAAVKANYPLTHEKMLHILEELRATAYSSICPHGRPVMLRLTRRELEKNFERI